MKVGWCKGSGSMDKEARVESDVLGTTTVIQVRNISGLEYGACSGKKRTN